ncbi:adenine-specific DNA-methyltransferase [Anaerovibrio lipolyticus DSM 3074]|uniref:Type III restriction endonuclease subunit M n=2 Tax=Anaerovibrio lipolyticus TaxID=82374 RepID=A0A0B2JZ95_9FIRM|nr:site-specific DNA-methyltransferase [Anaerovibrio lipolyticus]KHM51936.1 type III restriction endonuclease subunit M [Anaerovibrio lipolyticus]SHI58982.1 adenine-specific DNA-methyltransferase [Anaerovibrio lipolyticus DSM 3074]
MPVLEWIGKSKVVNHHLDVPFHVLNKQYTFDGEKNVTEGAASDNKIIHGDNLLALKSLLPEYEGKIKCIYIDPPYNTGNEGWVYNDNVNDPRIRKWLGEVVGKEGEDLSRHDKWLCMMYPRLKLLHRLLSDDGAIFISIDDNEKHILKLLCDEIFGSGNFISDIAVINNLKGRSDDKYIATAHEGLLIYQKGNFETNGVDMPEEYDRDYRLTDEQGCRYRLQGLRKRGSGARREDRPNMFYPFYYSVETDELSVERKNGFIEIYPHLSDGSDGRWRWGIDTSRARITELTVQKVRGRDEYDVFQKDYLPQDGVKRVKPKSFWLGTEFSAETGTLEVKSILGKGIFETSKPTGLIEYILQQAVDKDSIILDSFAGSGTTAHAVLNLNKADGGNRKFILIEMMDYAEDITAERVRRVIKGYGEGKKAVEGTGGDFSYYELGEPLLIDGLINENVAIDKLREYIYFTETHQRLEPARAEEPCYLGTNFGTAYYFCYDKENAVTMDFELLNEAVKTRADAYVIYADNCALSDSQLQKYNITFRKIPRDITKI